METPNREVETLNKLVDNLVEDFRTTMNFAIDLMKELPNYFFWEEDWKKRVVELRGINKTYFEEE